jgi:hypothetical protein
MGGFTMSQPAYDGLFPISQRDLRHVPSTSSRGDRQAASSPRFISRSEYYQ